MAIGTQYIQVEPIGFGLSPFGHPSDDKNEIEYGRGFGEPLTRYIDNEED